MSHLTAPTFRPRTIQIDPPLWRDLCFALAAGLFATIGIWIARHRGRQALQELAEHSDAHLLADIGVTREEGLRMAAKWFWQP